MTTGIPGPAQCARHRNVETYLRCGKCGTPICPKCLVHTPVGARCPDCARPARIARRGQTIPYFAGAGAGFGVAAVAGAMMTFVPGGLLILPLLLTCFLVGEAVSAGSRRRGGRGLALVAFTATLTGPVLGRAALIALLTPGPESAVRGLLYFTAALQSFGAFGLLFLAVAGVIASTRVDR
jgi:hypothetical protein